MNKGIKAMKALFDSSESVTCSKCGLELKTAINTRKLLTLSRCGCPQCGSKDFDFTVDSEETQGKLQAVLGERQCTRRY